MKKLIGALGCALALPAQAADTDSRVMPPDVAHSLIGACLSSPTLKSATDEATALGATAATLTAAQVAAATRPQTITSPIPETPGHSLRSDTAMSSVHVWQVNGSPPAQMVYHEGRVQQSEVSTADGNPAGPVRNFAVRQCDIVFKRINGKEAYTSFETLNGMPHGGMVFPDGKTFMFFMYAPDKLDIEIEIALDAPLANFRPNTNSDAPTRIVLHDGGPLSFGGVPAFAPVISLTRAALLSALDHPTHVHVTDMSLEPMTEPSVPSPAPPRAVP